MLLEYKLKNGRRIKLINENEYYFLLATLLENIDKTANMLQFVSFFKNIKNTASKVFFNDTSIF